VNEDALCRIGRHERRIGSNDGYLLLNGRDLLELECDFGLLSRSHPDVGDDGDEGRRLGAELIVTGIDVGESEAAIVASGGMSDSGAASIQQCQLCTHHRSALRIDDPPADRDGHRMDRTTGQQEGDDSDDDSTHDRLSQQAIA
jgi:hypothetical protein